jgi:hypothetical protein
MRLLVLSDVHYASDAEKTRRGHEGSVIRNPLLRLFAHIYRRYIWLDDPYGQNHLLDHVTTNVPSPDLVVANGDFNLDTRFVGVSDDASFQSAIECLGHLRKAYGDKLFTTIGDHEFGKKSLFGGAGGPRWNSYERTVGDLQIPRFWHLDTGHQILVGVASSLIALSLFTPEILPHEAASWQQAHAAHLAEIRVFFEALPRDRRILLFCHDPSALPFLYREPAIRSRLEQIEATIIGHLHTQMMYRLSRVLAGMPVLNMGHTARRYSSALREARCWRAFKVQLCPSLAGSELLKDGGYLTAQLADKSSPVTFQFHPIPR